MLIEFFKEVWNRAQDASSPIDPMIYIILFGSSLVLVIPAPLWRNFRNMVTVVHETGHAVMGVFLGEGLTGMTLHENTSGETQTRRSIGLIGWIGGIITTYSGYPFPAAISLGLSTLIYFNHANWGFLIATIVLLILLPFIRNLHGLGLLMLGIIFCGLSYWSLSSDVQSYALGFIAGFLLFGGLRTVIELSASHLKGDTQNSDVHTLSRFMPFLSPIIFATYYFIYIFCFSYGIYLIFNQ